MHTLAPFYLALTALGVLPILIHLMGRRRARVRPLPTLLLLYASHKRVAQRTQVRHVLLLLLRVLLFVVAPLILAKPYLETESPLPQGIGQTRSAVIVLDDSLSMRYVPGHKGATRRGGSLFARAKLRAQQVMEALPSSSEVALVLGSRGNHTPVRELTSDRVRLFGVLNQLQPTLGADDLPGALARAMQLLHTVQKERRHVYVITDGTTHALSSLVRPAEDVGLSIIDVSEGDRAQNSSILEIYSEPAPSLGARAFRISAEVANFGETPLRELAVTLNIDGQPVSSGFVDVPAHGRSTKRFLHSFRSTAPPTAGTAAPPSSPAPPVSDERRPTVETDPGGGLHHVSVSIPHDGLLEDDERHLRVEVQRHLRVLILDGDPRGLRRDDEAYYIETALHPSDRPLAENTPFLVQTAPLDEHIPELRDFEAVILCNAKAEDIRRLKLDRALRSYVTGGGGLLLSMGGNVEVEQYNTTLLDLLPQPLSMVKTMGALGTERVAEDNKEGEAAPLGSGERLGRLDRRHVLLQPFLSSQASESLMEARFGRYVLLQPTPKNESESGVILSFESGAPALIERQIERGRVLLFTSSLDRDWNDLPIQPSFLPLLQQAIRYLSRAPIRDAEAPILIGQPREIHLQTADARVELALPSGQKRLYERLQGRRLLTYPDTFEAGYYRVFSAPDPGAWRPRLSEFFVVNVDPKEMDLTPADASLIKGIERPAPVLTGPADLGTSPRRRIDLWHWLGLFTLLFLVSEALLFRQR